jgi:Tfp pilus assembly protein PilO
VLCAALGLVILLSGGIFWVQRGWLAEATDQLADKQSELQDGRAIAKRREEARSKLEADRALIANLEPGVSSAAFVPTLLKQLEALATQTQNRVVGVRPQVVQQGPSKIEQRRDPDAQAKGEANGANSGDKKDAKKELEEPYTRLEIEVNLQGKFASAQRFVDQLMRFPKIVSVDQMSIHPKPAGEKDEPGLLEIQLKVTAFIMKGEQPQLPAQPAVSASNTLTGSSSAGGIN